jgi:hypothetical protein
MTVMESLWKVVILHSLVEGMLDVWEDMLGTLIMSSHIRVTRP